MKTATADTNFYQIALAEFQQANPSTRRAVDLMSDTDARYTILQRAQYLKKMTEKNLFSVPFIEWVDTLAAAQKVGR